MRGNIEAALDKIRPALQADGGDVELLDVTDGIVYDDIAAPVSKSDFDTDSVTLYLAECRQTPLLTSQEERILGAKIENGKYLDDIEKSLSKERGKSASSVDVLVTIVGRLCAFSDLFDALRTNLKLEKTPDVHGVLMSKNVRNAIDNTNDPHLVEDAKCH